MKAQIKVLAIILITGLCLFGCSKAAKWQEQFDLGARFLSEGNYEEAILSFTQAIEIDPKSAEAYLHLAEAYLAVGDLESAEDILLKGIESAEVTEALQSLLESVRAQIIEEEKQQLLQQTIQKACVDIEDFFSMDLAEMVTYLGVDLVEEARMGPFDMTERDRDEEVVYILNGTYHLGEKPGSRDSEVSIFELSADGSLSSVMVYAGQETETGAQTQFSGWGEIYLGDTYEEVQQKLALEIEAQDRGKTAVAQIDMYSQSLSGMEHKGTYQEGKDGYIELHFNYDGVKNATNASKEYPDYRLEFQFDDGEHLTGVYYMNYALTIGEYAAASGNPGSVLDEELVYYDGIFKALPRIFHMKPEQAAKYLGMNMTGGAQDSAYWLDYTASTGETDGISSEADIALLKGTEPAGEISVYLQWPGMEEGVPLPDDIPKFFSGWPGIPMGMNYQEVLGILGLDGVLPDGLHNVFITIRGESQDTWSLDYMNAFMSIEGYVAPSIQISYEGGEGSDEWYIVAFDFYDPEQKLTSVTFYNSGLVMAEGGY